MHTHKQYSDAVETLQGIELPNVNTNPIHDLPITTLGYLIFKGYRTNLQGHLFAECARKFTVLLADIERAIATARIRPAPNDDDINDFSPNLYGFHTENHLHIRPWEYLYQLFLFERQIRDAFEVIVEVWEESNGDQDSDNSARNIEVFEDLVQMFITCATIIDKDILQGDDIFGESILRRRVSYFLSTDSLKKKT